MGHWSVVGIAIVSLALMTSVVGCAKRGWDRDRLEREWVAELVDTGIDEPGATCVIERFFNEMTDAELRAFNTVGDSLTELQSRRIEFLAGACGVTINVSATTVA